MLKAFSKTSGTIWTAGRVFMIRLFFYLLVLGFFLQFVFFGDRGRLYNPLSTIVSIGTVFIFSLLILLAGSRFGRLDAAIASTYAADIILLTRIVLTSGGFSSLFLPFYLPTLIMASASLPGHLTAIFPSLATLGMAYIGLAHLLDSAGGGWIYSHLYSPGILLSLGILSPNSAIASMLILAALFFVISYISSLIGSRIFMLHHRIREAEQELSRFSAISTMAAGLAHEIRNPLASLRSSIQEIGEGFPPGDTPNHTLVGIAISESDRLDRIIGRFLDFSRPEELRLCFCRLGPILREIRTLALKRPEAGDIDIRLDIGDDPEVQCDSDRIREVFLNLALNASQAAGPRGGRLSITLAVSRNSRIPGVETIFSDNGPGFGRETAKRLFDPFFTTKASGGGMGLPLSRKHVSMHGGNIEAGVNPGGGARFRVWLPLEQIASAARPDGREGDTVRIVRTASIRK
ncbi:MAG: hypothetical protein LBU64_09165 [Planctomycetota bacterium]|jgi:signal transduction histidine kinase|nr:hypothetical protein [Planctomycetota bacterium]